MVCVELNLGELRKICSVAQQQAALTVLTSEGDGELESLKWRKLS